MIFISLATLRQALIPTAQKTTMNAKSMLCAKACPAAKEIPDQVDPAMLMLGARLALEVVNEAAVKGVKGIVIVSAGFREVADRGATIDNRTSKMRGS